MNQHEFEYCRYLLSEIKRLQVEMQARDVLLDSWTSTGKLRNDPDWRGAIEKMAQDPVFCSAVDATFEPYLSQLKKGLSNPQILQQLLGK